MDRRKDGPQQRHPGKVGVLAEEDVLVLGGTYGLDGLTGALPVLLADIPGSGWAWNIPGPAESRQQVIPELPRLDRHRQPVHCIAALKKKFSQQGPVISAVESGQVQIGGVFIEMFGDPGELTVGGKDIQQQGGAGTGSANDKDRILHGESGEFRRNGKDGGRGGKRVRRL